MALFDSASLLEEWKDHAIRPDTDAQWDDEKIYRLLSRAQIQVMGELSALFPRLLMSPPILLATTDGGLTYHSTTNDGNGDPIYPMGHTEVYCSRGGGLGTELFASNYTTPGGVVLEGNRIRLSQNTLSTSGGEALYMRCVVMPDQISAAVEPTLQPPFMRSLIVYRALVLYANSGGRQDPQPYQQMYAEAWNGGNGTGGFLAMLSTQYRRSAEVALEGIRWWREWVDSGAVAWGAGAIRGSGGAVLPAGPTTFLGPVFSPEQFKSVGLVDTTGTASSQDAFDAMMAEVEAAGGGMIYLQPNATYQARMSWTVDNITLWMPSATLKHPDRTQRVVTDAEFVIGEFTVRSVAANFTEADLGAPVDIYNAGASADLANVAYITEILSEHEIRVSRAHEQTNSAQRMRINFTQNVIESSLTHLASALGNSTTNHTIIGGTIDGNKSGTSAPLIATDDRGGHGWILTQSSRGRAIGVTFQNCHNAGLDVVVNSDGFYGDGITIDNCGNATSIPAGFELNSSQECSVSATITDCNVGARTIDNFYDCTFDLSIVRTARQGWIVDNQSVNVSRNCIFRGLISEACQTSAFQAFSLQGKVQDSLVDVTVQYAGASRGGTNTYTFVTAATGVQIGSESHSDAIKPQRNTIRARISNCGGAGVLDRGTRNTFDCTYSDNGRMAALTTYALDVGGSYNTHTAIFNNTLSTQRGCAVRAVVGEVGTAATGNNFFFPRGQSPQNEWDDTSGNFTNVPPARNHPRRISADQGDANVTFLPYSDAPIILFSSAVAVPRTVTLSTVEARRGDWFEVWRKGAGAGTIDVGGLKTIPAATNAIVRGEFDGSAWVLAGYQLL